MDYKERKLNIRSGVICIDLDRNNTFWQIFWIGLFALAYWGRDMAGISVPDIVFTGICAAAFLMTDVGTSLGIFIFTSALTVPHIEIRFVYVAILLCKLIFLGGWKPSAGMLLMTLGMFLLQLVDILMFSTGNLATEVYNYGVNVLYLIVPLLWFGAKLSVKDYRRALLCYMAGVMLGGTVALILTANEVTWKVLLAGEMSARLGTTESVTDTMQTTYNANQLAGMFGISVAILVGAMDQKRMSKLLALPLIGYSLFIVVLTRSRTGLLLMVLIVLIFYWVTVFRRKRFWTGLWILLAVVLLVVVVFSAFPGAVEAFQDRFTNQKDITSGRTDLFARYLEAWSEDPWCFFFGYGIGSFGNMVDIWEVPHNAITDILICWGLIGLLLIVAVLYLQYKRAVSSVEKKDRILAALPAIVAVFSSMAGQYISVGFPHMRLSFLLLAAAAFAKPEEKQANTLEKA